MPAHASRVLFLGLDGGTMTALEPWFERGLTPNLAAHWARSARGSLRSSEPMVTPVAWTSFATGCTPRDHGIHDFYYIDRHDRTIRSNHAGRVRTPTLWQSLGAEGREVVSLNLPMTYPPPRVRGVVVAGADAPGLPWPFAQCPEFGREVAGSVPDYSHKLLWKVRPKTDESFFAQAARNRAIFRAQADVAELADRYSDWSALMVHFHNLDSIQHRLWPELRVDETGRGCRREWVPEVENCLRALDEAIGRLLELASKRDAAVITVSDHGFGPCKAIVNVNGILHRAGLHRGKAYGTRFRYRAQRLGDRLHRWLTSRSLGARGLRPPRSIEGTVGCDWKRTVAFAPFGQLCGAIFLNRTLADTASKADRATSEVIDAFRDARDPETGALLFRDVFSTAERYGIDPVDEGVPEIFALSADGYQAQAKWGVSLRTELMRPDPDLPGTHYRHGVLAVEGPGVSPGNTLDADLHDVAPTTLALLDLPIPETMTGRVIHEAFDEPLAVRHCERPVIEDDPDYDRLIAAGFGAECT